MTMWSLILNYISDRMVTIVIIFDKNLFVKKVFGYLSFQSQCVY